MDSRLLKTFFFFGNQFNNSFPGGGSEFIKLPMNPVNANPNSLHKLNANFATHAPLLMNNATTT